MRAALHDGKTVQNVIVYDPEGEYEPPEGLTLVPLDDDSRVSLGWLVEDGELVEPPRDDAPEHEMTEEGS